MKKQHNDKDIIEYDRQFGLFFLCVGAPDNKATTKINVTGAVKLGMDIEGKRYKNVELITNN